MTPSCSSTRTSNGDKSLSGAKRRPNRAFEAKKITTLAPSLDSLLSFFYFFSNQKQSPQKRQTFSPQAPYIYYECIGCLGKRKPARSSRGEGELTKSSHDLDAHLMPKATKTRTRPQSHEVLVYLFFIYSCSCSDLG
jgi:hypothetical protein